MAGALVVACGGSGPAVPSDWNEVVVADVTLDVPADWDAVPDGTDGFDAGLWTGPPAEDGTRLGISIDVACTSEPDDDAEQVLDRYLDGPQWRGHEVVGRAAEEVPGAASGARSVSRHVLPTAAGDDVEVTRHAVTAVREGVVALVLVEGATAHLPTGLAERVRDSIVFEAAAPERVGLCRVGASPTGAPATTGA